MNQFRIAYTLAGAALMLYCGQALATETADHLVPVDKEFQRYRQLLMTKLAPAGFGCGRMTIQPAFEPESSVSVQCDNSKTGEPKCHTTYVVAEKNLWQLTDGGKDIDKANNVGTSRKDVGIPAYTAKLIKRVWVKMLAGTRAFDEHVPERTFPTDATFNEFSLQRDNAPPLPGDVNIFLPRQGQHVRRLLEIGNLLVEYCKANENKRAEINGRIERAARQLLATQ